MWITVLLTLHIEYIGSFGSPYGAAFLTRWSSRKRMHRYIHVPPTALLWSL